MRIPLLRICAIAGLLVAASIAFGAVERPVLAGPNCSVASGAASIDNQELAMFGLINQHRANNGLPPVQLSNTLNSSAAWKSRNMADNSYFGHDDSPIGRSWGQRFRDCGYTYNTFTGEIIAAGHQYAIDTFNQWAGSAGHNGNMLNANYAAIGLGRAYSSGSAYGWYWTADFGGVADGYSPPPVATPARPPLTGPVPLGDANCDRYVDAIDAALVLQRVAGRISSLPCAQEADANGDGQITAVESALILQYAAGLISHL
jgi:uncharacterized protein YkwD